jgi:hypothetical protein
MSVNLYYYYYYYYYYSHLTPVNIVASMEWKKEGQLLAEAGIFCSLCDCHFHCGNHTASDSAADCSRQLGTEVKNVWIYISTSPYLYLSWCIITHKNYVLSYMIYDISLLCTVTNKCTIISHIITLLHVSTLSSHPQGDFKQYLAKLHQHFKCSCWQYNL